MRTIGIDLGVRAAHRAIVVDAQGEFVTPLLSFHPRPDELANLLAQARAGAPEPALQAVMEPTGLSWLPVAVYLHRQGVGVYLVSGQKVADLRRYYRRHAKSDQIDARVLARQPLVNPDGLIALHLASATQLACQRGCRELERLSRQIVASQQRLRAIDRAAWPGLEQVLPEAFGPVARWFRRQHYQPAELVALGAEHLAQTWPPTGQAPAELKACSVGLVALAEQVLGLYGSDGHWLDFGALQAEVRREQARLEALEGAHRQLQVQTVRRLYRRLHPSRYLETIRGVGQDGAAVFASFIGDPKRFASLRAHRGWSGLVPASRQSGTSEVKGLHISQAGPRLIKKFAFMDAQTARQWDPQLAALYYDQMVHKGKHHNQALCAVATHLLDRILIVLRQERPYELRDVDGTPLTPAQARAIVQARYTVPEGVRRRITKQARQARAEQRTEHQRKRETTPAR